MAKDLLQYWNGNGFTDLGEVQQGFNLSFTLDGSKDSAHFSIYNFDEETVTPYTILLHKNTNTFWICSHDKTTRVFNEDGFYYLHELECLGLIELLNARDLTDCGFRANKYNIVEFVLRLFKLSNFEWNTTYITIDDHDSIDLYQTIDYVKTFENYTLLSALNELFNGYNCSLKARIEYFNSHWYFILETIPKSGDISLDALDIDDFNQVKMVANFDKNSYGAIAISNAENVISNKSIRYPVVGTTRAKTLSYKLDSENACIILPSPAYKVNKLGVVSNYYSLEFKRVGDNTGLLDGEFINPYDKENLSTSLKHFANSEISYYGQGVVDEFLNNLDIICENIKLAASFEFYDGFLYDPLHGNDSLNNLIGSFKYPKNAPSGMKLITVNNLLPTANPSSRQVILTDKTTRDSLAYVNSGIYWERGSNLIRGFGYIGGSQVALSEVYGKSIDPQYSILGTGLIIEMTVGINTYTFTLQLARVDFDNDICSSFYVDYVPMSSLKICSNNGIKKNEIQLYNQTGKLCDSNALSKLITSYSSEITSGNITRNSQYYNLLSIPKVGQLVDNNGVYFIINNISSDYYQNERDYYVECELTLSKRIAAKSLMVNSDSNIRDYGIPQNYNVKRKEVYGNAYQCVYSQTYADVELSIQNAELPRALNMYQDSVLMYSFPFETGEQFGYVAFIEVTGYFATYSADDEPMPSGTTSAYYYKLDCTKTILKNQVIVSVDFNDNNIIGYDNQSVATAWSASNFFQAINRTISTPISYVDENGELTGINIRFLRGENAMSVYNQYSEDSGYNTTYLFSGSIFLDTSGDIFDIAGDYQDFEIVASEYNKDAIEVPFFEASYQLISSDNIIVGENIFNSHEGENIIILYGFVQTNNEINELNYKLFIDDGNLSYDGTNLILTNACRVFYFPATSRFNINAYSNITYTISNGHYVMGNQTPFTSNKNVMVYRLFVDKSTKEIIDKELMFICKKVPSSNIVDGYIMFETNIYKLK